MAALTSIVADLDGTAVTFAAASGGGDSIPASRGAEYLVHFNNASGGSITVTVNDPTSFAPEGATAFNPDTTITLPAGTQRLVKLTSSRFMDGDGNILLTYSGVTSLTVAVYRV
jgi:hypothetical protein